MDYQCRTCRVKFDVAYEGPGASVRHCPSCGSNNVGRDPTKAAGLTAAAKEGFESGQEGSNPPPSAGRTPSNPPPHAKRSRHSSIGQLKEAPEGAGDGARPGRDPSRQPEGGGKSEPDA